MPPENVVWHASPVSLDEREAANPHKAAVMWFTGLPSSGKSTTAHEVEHLPRMAELAKLLYGAAGRNPA